MKVVGIGLNKTGTKTLSICLTQWGYNHFTWDLASFQQYQRGIMKLCGELCGPVIALKIGGKSRPWNP